MEVKKIGERHQLGGIVAWACVRRRQSGPKRKGSNGFLRCSPGWYPPQVLRRIELLQLWPSSAGASCPNCFRSSVPRRVVVDDAVFVRAEAAHTSLVEGRSRAADRVAQERRSSGSAADAEIEAALRERYCGGLRQVPVDQASSSDQRTTSRTARDRSRPKRAHTSRASGIALRGIGGIEADLTRVGGTNRASRGRLVGRDTRAQQVRNGDSSDDKNNRYYDKQLNQ
jgi:hypothetical protein